MNDIRYKEFLNEESESLSEFKIQALLVISNKSGRMKTDILSNIRAIQGITRVHVDEVLDRAYYEISKLTIKVNIAPFGIASLDQIFSKIKKDIISIQSIQRFTYISKPSKI